MRVSGVRLAEILDIHYSLRQTDKFKGWPPPSDYAGGIAVPFTRLPESLTLTSGQRYSIRFQMPDLRQP